MGKMMAAALISSTITLLLASVDGFGILLSLHQHVCYCSIPVGRDGISWIDKRNRHHLGGIRARSLLYSLSLKEEHSPSAPQNDIDAQLLLSQVRNQLTLKDLKNVLSSCNVSTSGTKSQLIDKLGMLLNGAKPEVVNSKQLRIKKDANSYKRLAIKQLRDELRQRGAKTSGRKAELVQRLIDLDRVVKPSDTSPTYDDDWHILEPTVSYHAQTNAVIQQIVSDEDMELELPILSALLFVNKPSGMSTLPTRDQLLQETNSNTTDSKTIFPCLSDKVKEWLFNHPDGIKRMEQAKNDEEQYWNLLLQSISAKNDRNAQKLLKKKQRQREKLSEKMASFEPRPVHRLDIDTSGIVCIALTPYALRTGGMLFEQKSRDSIQSENASHSVMKRYVALVEGILTDNEQEENTVSHSIGKIWVSDNPQNASSIAGHHEWACDIFNDERIAFCRPEDGNRSDPLKFVQGSVRDALTSYRVLDLCMYDKLKMHVTLVELTPHTGRGHQLRLHMASLDHPIVGDDMHGAPHQKKYPDLNGGKLCLHAANLAIECWEWHVDKIQRCRAEVISHPRFKKMV